MLLSTKITKLDFVDILSAKIEYKCTTWIHRDGFAI